MAKKKTDEIEIANDNYVERIQRDIEKVYGEGGFLSAEQFLSEPNKIISWSPALDIILGGGIPEGSWVSINGPPKYGKAQPYYSKVYTPTGPKNMGDLVIGDEICCPDGSTSKIIHIFEQGIKDIYRIYFNDGDFTDCCEEHLWKVKSHNRTRYEVIPLKILKNQKIKDGDRLLWEIDVTQPVYFKSNILPIDPYYLGLLLGDGSFRGGSVTYTSQDAQLINYIKKYSFKYNCKVNHQSNNYKEYMGYRIVTKNKRDKGILINDLMTKIRDLKLWGHSSLEKFIPDIYKYSSIKDRIHIIQGLMDTDGCVNKNGTPEFYTSSLRLAKDFKFLIQSIGGICKIHNKKTKCNGKIFKSYRCRISVLKSNLLLRLKKKKNRCFNRKKPLKRRISKIEKISSSSCRCIVIDSPEQLYLTDNFIVTHNSSAALSFAANAQRPENGGKTIYYLAVEGRLKEKNIHGTKGLDLSPEKFRIINSTKNKIYSTQDFLTQAEMIIKTHPGCVVIIDSVSALADEKELAGGIGTQTRGHNNVVIGQFINNMATTVPVMKSIVMGITHRIANTSGYGAPTAEKAANRWLYQSDVRIRFKQSKPWKLGANGREIGKEMSIECVESALGPPGMICTSFLRYGVGIDRLKEIMDFAISCGLIVPKGAWYNMAFLENKPELLTGTEYEGKEKVQFQGEENVYQSLIKNQTWQTKLEEEVKQLSGTLVSYSAE